MTTHHFNIDEAKTHGVDAAIILSNIRFWLAKNHANERHFYQGRYWTYNSARAFAELFPYWSQSQIRRILAKLVADGVLVVSEFNSNPYDHTKWYSLNEGNDVTKSEHRITETVTSQTDIKPDKKPDIKTPHTPTGVDVLFDAFWKAYPKKVAKDAARKAFNRRKPDEELLKTILKAVEQHKHSDTWSRGYVPNPATWINDARWQDEIVGKPAMTVAINKQEALEARNRAVVQRLLQKEGLA